MRPDSPRFEIEEKAMDVLSDVLGALRIHGENLCRTEARAPWGLSFTAREAQFHVIERGECLLQTSGSAETVRLRAGDLVVLPHGRGHSLFDSHRSAIVPVSSIVEKRKVGRVGVLRVGGEGAPTTVFCGQFVYDAPFGEMALSGFPAVIHVAGKEGRPAEWLALAIRLRATEVRSEAPGREVTLSRLMDLLFVEAVRHWMASGAAPPRGYLRALRDPRIGAALAKMHEHPERGWNVPSLAAEVGMSRSSLNQRFVELVGESPAKYLTRWRMQVASRLLQAPGVKIAQIAEKVGYSEAAFSRVFKRQTGMSPAALRRKTAGKGEGRERNTG